TPWATPGASAQAPLGRVVQASAGAAGFAATPLAGGSGPAVGTPGPAGGGPALQPVGISAAEPATSSALRTGRKSKPNPALLVASLVGGTIVVILVLLILNNAGKQTPTGEREAVASDSGDGSGTGLGPANNLTGQGPAATGGQRSSGGAEDLTGLRPVATGGQNPGGSGGQTPGGSGGQTLGGTGGGGDDEGSPRQTVVPDDGQMLWASPTAGRPWRLNYFAPGAQVLCGFRPAAMLQSESGRQVLEALGPQMAATRSEWERTSGVVWEEVDRMLVGWFDAGEQLPRACCAVWLQAPRSEQELLSDWGNPPAADGGFYQAGGTAYYIPPQADGPSFVMGHPSEIQELASLRGAVPPMARGLERLLASSDDQRDFTLLVVPSYLSSNVLRDGRQYYFGQPAPLRGALEWLLGDDVQAGLVSMHFGAQFYWELRLHSMLSRDYRTLASELRDRIAQVPDAIERHIVSLNPHPYWRMVAFRYPSMIRFLHRHARIGVEDEQAVVNGVLPGEAAHNLVFGGEMVLSAGPGTPVAVAVAGDGPAAKPMPKSVEEVLKLQMDLMFDQTSLEFSMRDLAADVNETHKLGDTFDIRIIGDDLKLEGITRNQQIRDFAQKGQTVADILTALVRKANPVTTVQDPSEVDQKLIWVVAPDPEKPDRKIVLITTRSAAATKSYTLPEPFRPKQ
ncbi:MAG: hypothetical protein J5I93_23385, partial [Pirellulaceae bacterium]|nr:hypothetical protein [Pirellulaceae bacterium]